MDNAFGWIKSNGGLCTEDDYPYTSGSGSSGSCKTSCSKAATLTGWSDVKSGDEDALKSAVEKGPVSVAIEADQSVFQLYSGGVFTSAEQCGTQLDHGVLVVGYGKWCSESSIFNTRTPKLEHRTPKLEHRTPKLEHRYGWWK